jgi:hypothetical protein
MHDLRVHLRVTQRESFGCAANPELNLTHRLPSTGLSHCKAVHIFVVVLGSIYRSEVHDAGGASDLVTITITGELLSAARVRLR